ncbi:unnamed protein product [Phaedon cochleariae]|uniref:H15 domain-containing protein n=1 Tax=Phaedon cochleariae TaxID=80249 RepID=A0A9P0GY35_PHACE|nr:unnamed protein product [Phaedon cochleariae]
MKSKQPRFLNEVMDAIAVLKDSKGSPAKKVIERVEKGISKVSNLRNPVGQIQKALLYGVDNGLITQNGGNFKLGLNNKEYQLFKDFKSLSGDGLFREHRRRGRRGRRKGRRRSRRGRRRGRRRSAGIYSAQLGLESDLVPEDRARRRRRKRRSRRGGRRRRHDARVILQDNAAVNEVKVAEIVNTPKHCTRPANSQRVERNETTGRGCFVPNSRDTNSNCPDSNKNHTCYGNSGFLCERPEVNNRHPPCYNNCQGNCNCPHNMY